MPSGGEAERKRLGALVARRRNELSLSLQAAARAAGIARPTWTGLERATAQTETYIYARVERVLSWKPGSIEKVLAGEEPEELDTTNQPPTNSGRPGTPDDLVRRIWADPHMELAEKERWVEMITRAEAQRAAAQAMIEAAEERLRRGA